MDISSLIEPLFENFENPIISMLAVSTVETLYMVFLSTLFSLLLGFPKEYGIDISVLGGTIDKLATMNIGHLYLELDGDLSAQDKAIELMGTMDVIVEVIYNGY